MLASLVLLGGLAFSLLRRPQSQTGAETTRPLVIYCAASNKSVLEAIRRDYERDYKTQLQIQYGPSQTLLASLEVTGTGDLYLPADDSYLQLARERKLLAGASSVYPLATMQGVVAVPKGNPRRISRLDDLLQGDVRVAQASVEASAIGKITRDVLTSGGHWEGLH